MGVTYGFYNSKNKDRIYNTEQISRIFDGIIVDGVYSTIGKYLMVDESSGMTIKVGTGRAWFNHTWTLNDSDLYLTAEESEVILDRIDAVILEINANDSYRANSIKILKGTPASTAVAPTLTNTEYLHQYPLAYLSIKKGVTEITKADINNRVGTTDCPFVTGLLEHVSTSELLAQWEAQYESWFSNAQNAFTDEETTLRTTFNSWFDGIKGQLSTDAAGHLQQEIDATNTALQNEKSIITKANVQVKASDAVADSTFADYPYRVDIAVTGCTSDYRPEIDLEPNDASSIFYDLCKTDTDKVSVWLANNTFGTITILTLQLTKQRGA